MNQEHIHARQLLILFRDRIANGDGPIHGYAVAAEMIGLNGDTHARHMGQVTSRIDAASFVSGWPMLAVHMVRKPNGEVNPESFRNEWINWSEESKEIATTHHWTVEQIDEITGVLDSLPNASAKNIWDGYMKRESQNPGFIRYNLHRKINSKSP